jgi:hypothetical protein
VSFGFPLGLLTLAALAPLTAAYFLRRRQKPVRVSALFLWRTPHQKAEAGPRLERYSRELSFALEVLALLVATAFIADLRFGKEILYKQLVVVVDGDLSMSARPPAGIPIAERARRAAAKAAHDEGATALTVVETGAHPHVLAGPQARVSEALAALEAWRPMGGVHELSPSFLLARELAGPRQRVEFFTDRMPPPGLGVPPEIHWVALGEPLDNLAFVAAQRRDEGERAVVTVRVANFGKSPARAQLLFAAKPTAPGGRATSHAETVELAPDGSQVVRVSFTGAGPIDVSLPDDALPEDGRLTLLPSPVRELEVKILDGLGPAERRALEHFLGVEPGLRGGVPVGQHPLSFSPPGTGADVTLGAAGKLHSFVGPFFAQKGDALLEDVDLAGVVWTAGDSPPGRALVSANDVALVTEDGARLHLNVDLSRSSLGRTQAWPILLGNVVRRARLGLPGFPQRQVLLGDSVSVVTEAGVVFTLAGPGGERAVLGRGLVSVAAPPSPGHYVLKRDGVPFDALEVLPIDARESDLRTRGAGAVNARVEPPVALAALSRNRSLWPLVLMLVLIAADFVLTARRRA